jgi:hypothetical protein
VAEAAFVEEAAVAALPVIETGHVPVAFAPFLVAKLDVSMLEAEDAAAAAEFPAAVALADASPAFVDAMDADPEALDALPLAADALFDALVAADVAVDAEAAALFALVCAAAAACAASAPEVKPNWMNFARSIDAPAVWGIVQQ